MRMDTNMRKLLFGLSLGALFCLQVGAQQPAKPTADDAGASGDLTFVTGLNVVQAPVTVLDRNGNVVNNLNVLDFDLFDNGKQQMISQDFATHPLSLVVVVQANAVVEKII